MTQQTSTSNAIELVRSEIDATIETCELSLGRFLDDRDSGEDLQNCIDCLNQLRGIFVVVEVKGAETLCHEAIKLANEVPVGASEDKNILLSRLSDAVFMLKKYTEYLAHAKKDFPELLLPTINSLRMVMKASLFSESHFVDFPTPEKVDLLSVFTLDDISPLSDFSHHAARFRHMYQVALLDVLKGRNEDIAFRLMARATEGSTRLCIGYNLAPFWALVSLLANVSRSESLAMLDVRKRLFMRIERFLRDMVKNGEAAADAELDTGLVNEIIFTLVVSGADVPQVQQLKGQLGVQVSYSEAERKAEADVLFGPGNDVLASLAKAVNEELMGLKEKLDLLQRGSQPDNEDVAYISDTLSRLAGTLTMLNMPLLSASAQNQVELVSSWSNAGYALTEEELLITANVVLSIENTIKRFNGASATEKAQLDNAADENAYLKEAHSVVVEESKQALALTKRAISAFIESDGDKMHLTNISASLETMKGGMKITDRARVAAIVNACMRCIASELLDAHQMPEERLLETLADALSSLEFYLESLSMNADTNDELLKLSEESLVSIGYEVSLA
jgi:hypothetical protein